MKRQSTPYLLLAALVILFASCSKKAKILVPEDAAIVVHINGASLNSKLSWDEIKQSKWYKIAYRETKDDLSKKILDNPEVSGIDIKSDAYFFVKVQGRNAYTGFTCSIKDEKAFAAFMAKTTEGKPAGKEGDLSIIASGDNVLTWNSSHFVFIGSNSHMRAHFNFGDDYNPRKRQRLTEDSLIKFAKAIYDLKNSESIASNGRFSDLMNEKGDIHLWMNTGKLYGGSLPAVFSLTKASTLFEGNATAAALNFDNGKISIDGKTYYNKELAELHKKYSRKNIDENMLKKIASDNVAAVIAMNYPPEGLKAFLNILGVDGLINMFLGQSDFGIDDFVKANKGDLMLAVSDFEFGEKEIKLDMGDKDYTYKITKPDAKILFATSVNDKASFEKLITLLRGKMGEESGFENKIAGKIRYKLLDNWFIAGTDSGQVNSFSTTNIDQPFIKKISGHPMGGFIDIQKFITGSKPSMESDSSVLRIADESLKYWQDIVFYGGEYKNGGTESHIEINLVDKSTNSLKQLSGYFGLIAKTMKEKEDAYRNWGDEPKMDTMLVAPKSK